MTMSGIVPLLMHACYACGALLCPFLISVGVMLPVGAIGAIVMPWIIGQVADLVSLQAGMMVNLIPCAGIMILSIILMKMKK